MFLYQIPLLLVPYYPGIMKGNSACGFSGLALSLEKDTGKGKKGRGSCFCLHIISSLFSKTILCTIVLMRGTPLPETYFRIWYLIPALTVRKATEANPEALNLHTISPERSLRLVSFPCCHSLENKFTHSHQPSTSKLDPGQEQAALLRSGQRGGRVSEAPVGWKHARPAGQQLEEVWACWQGHLRVADKRTEPTSSGNPAAGLYLLPFLPQRTSCLNQQCLLCLGS